MCFNSTENSSFSFFKYYIIYLERGIYMNKELIIEKAKEKFSQQSFTVDFFYRADYIILGYLVNCIEGIIVGREVEFNLEYLNQIKNLFPNCYISNMDGKVIY